MGFPLLYLCWMSLHNWSLVGFDSAWLFQPYEAFLAAMLALGVYGLLAGVVESRPLRALTSFIAAQPALPNRRHYKPATSRRHERNGQNALGAGKDGRVCNSQTRTLRRLADSPPRRRVVVAFDFALPGGRTIVFRPFRASA